MHALETAWDGLRRDFDSACSQAALAARRQTTASLNQIFRRFRHYQSEGEWFAAAIDAASQFASQVGIFAHQEGVLRLRGQKELNVADDLEIPVSAGGAFAAAIESRDPVVALRRSGEVGEALSVADHTARVHLFPILNDKRVVAVLFAGGGSSASDDSTDVDALELTAGLASAVLERSTNQSLHARISSLPAALPVTGASPSAAGASASADPETSPVPDISSQPMNELHLRARRFARVAVAEMQLNRPEACRAGLEQSSFYMLLQKEIDKAREAYRKQFMNVPFMVDYFHQELVATAAQGDETKLGEDYPGQLV